MQTKNRFGRIFLIALALALVTTWGIAPAVASGDNRGNEESKNGQTTTGGTDTQRGATSGDMSGMSGQMRYLVVIPTSGKDNCQKALQDFSSALGTTGMGGAYSQRDGGTTGRTNGKADGSVGGRVGTNGGDTDVDIDMDTDRGTTTDRGTDGTTPGKSKSGTGAQGATGMGQMSSWQWGCNNDDQTIYLFINATSETVALQHVPSEMRDKAKVIRLGQFGNTNIPSQPMQNKTPSGGGSGGY